MKGENVCAKRGNEQVVVTIEDQGLGIPEADRKHLFDRYYRGSNVTGIVGSGIGLYLVKTVIDLHGGEVSAESEEGKGSRFIVKVPVSLAPRDSQRGSEPPAARRLADNLRVTAGTKLDCAN